MVIALVLITATGCKKKKSIADLFDGGGAATPLASVASSAPVLPPPYDAGVSPDVLRAAADLAKAKDLLRDLQWCVAHAATQNPANAGEGDASTACDDIAAMRAKPSSLTDPNLAQTLSDASALCAFDIPLVTANEAIEHLRNGTSQASKLLMCTVAQKEIAKARAVHPKDAKVARTDARRASACR